jgi:hypothetical protein
MLYVDGASNVYGDDLEDRMLAWPFVLGQDLNLSVNNVAIRGKSNQHILFDLINYCVVDKPTFVIIGWQSVIRKMIVRRENNHIVDMSIDSGNGIYNESSEFKKYQQLTYKQWSNFLYDAWNFLQIVICAQHFLKAHNIPYLMFNDVDQKDILSLLTISSADAIVKDYILDAFEHMNDTVIENIEQSINSLYYNIDHDQYYDFSWCTYKLIKFYSHPTPEQHQILADFIKDLVTKRL